MSNSGRNDKRVYDVLVIGGGPVGLMCGYLLRGYFGLDCAVLEKESQQGKYSRAFGMTPRTLELMDSLNGLGQEMRDSSVTITGFQHHVGKSVIDWSGFFGKIDDARDSIISVEQSRQAEILEKRYIQVGGELHRGQECVDVLCEKAYSTVLCKSSGSGESASFCGRYILGADGGRSFLRKKLGVSFDGYTASYIVWLADMSHPGEECGAFRTYFSHMGSYAEMHLGPHFKRVMVGWENENALKERKATVEEFLTEARLRSGQDFAKCEISSLTALRFNYRLASKYRIDNIFLLGDAAHVHSPAGGQGLNLGYQDALNLCWKLATVIKENASVAILDSYEKERRPLAQATLEATARARYVIVPHKRFLLPYAFRLAEALRPLWWSRRLGALRKLYQVSLQSQDGMNGFNAWRGRDMRWSKCEAKVGCRLPNFIVQTPSSGEKWMSELRDYSAGQWIYVDGVGSECLDNYAWRYLVPKLKAPEPYENIKFSLLRITFCEWSTAFTEMNEEALVVVPRDIVKARAYLVGNESAALFFVRPDGLVGLRSRPASTYLDHFRGE